METVNAHRGGNINIITGVGGVDLTHNVQGPNGHIGFYVAPEGSQLHEERIRIDPDGGFYVNGQKVVNDRDLYEAMRIFFLTARHEAEEGFELAEVDGVLTSVRKEG